MWMWWWMACGGSPVDAPPGEVPPERDLEPTWQSCAELRFDPVVEAYDSYMVLEVVQDVTGDGIEDALVIAEAHRPPFVDATLVLPGPLHRTFDLPDDAVAVVGASYASVDDLDADGVGDLWWPGCAILGPVAGALTREHAVDAPGQPFDVDGDGVFERLDVMRGYPSLTNEFRRGSFGNWDAEPFLSIRPSCTHEGNGWLESPGFYPLQSVPDLDLDGAPELFLAGWYYNYRAQPCADFWLRSDLSGFIDPVTDHVAWPSRPAVAVGDQDGDGITDALVDGAIVAGPLAIASPAPSGARSLGTVVEEVKPLGLDLNEDGFGDFVALYGEVQVYTGGPDGGVFSGAVLMELTGAWRVENTLFLQDGHAWQLVQTLDDRKQWRAEARDLGPGTRVE